MTIDPFLRLPVKPVNMIISELAELQDRVRSGESIVIPDVTLLLNSGRNTVGSILRIVTASEGEMLLLLRSKVAPMDVTYLPISAILGVTVHYCAENLHLLSSGKIKLTSGSVPSRLNLERQVRSLSTQLSPTTVTVAWDEMVTSNEAFHSLAPLITNLQEILLGLQAEPLGLAALLQIERIEIRFGLANIIRRDRVIEIGIAIEDQDLLVLPKLELRQSIERLL
jgi:hypothetical protein